MVQVKIADGTSGDAVSDWLIAERELQADLGMRRATGQKIAYVEGYSRAREIERERIERRYRQIGQSTSAGRDSENRLRAEQELTEEGVFPLCDDI
jgi:hypothetical protein